MIFKIIESQKVAGATIELDAEALETLRCILNYTWWLTNDDMNEIKIRLNHLKESHRL